MRFADYGVSKCTISVKQMSREDPGELIIKILFPKKIDPENPPSNNNNKSANPKKRKTSEDEDNENENEDDDDKANSDAESDIVVDRKKAKKSAKTSNDDDADDKNEGVVKTRGNSIYDIMDRMRTQHEKSGGFGHLLYEINLKADKDGTNNYIDLFDKSPYARYHCRVLGNVEVSLPLLNLHWLVVDVYENVFHVEKKNIHLDYSRACRILRAFDRKLDRHELAGGDLHLDHSFDTSKNFTCIEDLKIFSCVRIVNWIKHIFPCMFRTPQFGVLRSCLPRSDCSTWRRYLNDDDFCDWLVELVTTTPLNESFFQINLPFVMDVATTYAKFQRLLKLPEDTMLAQAKLASGVFAALRFRWDATHDYFLGPDECYDFEKRSLVLSARASAKNLSQTKDTVEYMVVAHMVCELYKNKEHTGEVMGWVPEHIMMQCRRFKNAAFECASRFKEQNKKVAGVYGFNIVEGTSNDAIHHFTAVLKPLPCFADANINKYIVVGSTVAAAVQMSIATGCSCLAIDDLIKLRDDGDKLGTLVDSVAVFIFGDAHNCDILKLADALVLLTATPRLDTRSAYVCYVCGSRATVQFDAAWGRCFLFQHLLFSSFWKNTVVKYAHTITDEEITKALTAHRIALEGTDNIQLITYAELPQRGGTEPLASYYHACEKIIDRTVLTQKNHVRDLHSNTSIKDGEKDIIILFTNKDMCRGILSQNDKDGNRSLALLKKDMVVVGEDGSQSTLAHLHRFCNSERFFFDAEIDTTCVFPPTFVRYILACDLLYAQKHQLRSVAVPLNMQQPNVNIQHRSSSFPKDKIQHLKNIKRNPLKAFRASPLCGQRFCPADIVVLVVDGEQISDVDLAQALALCKRKLCLVTWKSWKQDVAVRKKAYVAVTSLNFNIIDGVDGAKFFCPQPVV